MARVLGQIPARVEGGFHVVVESPRGARVKWKYEPEWNAFTISRPLPLGLAYPYDWGFVPSSHAPDGDPLDVMIVWDQENIPGVVVPCRAIGVLKIEQDAKENPGKRERNDRLLAVPLAAPRQEPLTSVFDLSQRERDELEHFFQAVVAFENKNLAVLGWNGADEAERVLAKCIRTRKKR